MQRTVSPTGRTSSASRLRGISSCRSPSSLASHVVGTVVFCVDGLEISKRFVVARRKPDSLGAGKVQHFMTAITVVRDALIRPPLTLKDTFLRLNQRPDRQWLATHRSTSQFEVVVVVPGTPPGVTEVSPTTTRRELGLHCPRSGTNPLIHCQSYPMRKIRFTDDCRDINLTIL